MSFSSCIFKEKLRRVLLLCIIVLIGNPALAQIQPDESLGNEASIVDSESGIDTVRGGVRQSNSLFHSFRDFNVNDGQRVFFDSPEAINTIFSRVTGPSPSYILGILGVIGDADLFFLNPNGIVFGLDAQLDLSGSFIATTAESVLFGEELTFSTSNPQRLNPLLTVGTPTGLQYGSQNGTITNQSRYFDPLIQFAVGLQSQPGQTLGLLGGDIYIEGGTIDAFESQVELGAVASNSTVGLRFNSLLNNWEFDYSTVQGFQDILLSDEALIFLGNEEQPGGRLSMQGNQVDIVENSEILSENYGAESGGSISIRASERINISDATLDRRSRIATSAFGTGGAGDILLNAPHITVEESARVLSSDQFSFLGAGSGDITINAQDLLEILGVSAFNPTPALISTQSSGDGGNVRINTARLSLQDGGGISTSIIGDGQGGTIEIAASKIELSGIGGLSEEGEPFRSTIFAGTDSTASGSAGSILIDRQDESSLVSITISDGAEISADAFASGSGGDITIQNASTVLVTGFSQQNENLGSRLAATTDGPGAAGNISINTNQLVLSDGGQLLTTTFADGNAGVIEVSASEFVETRGGTDIFASGLVASSQGDLEFDSVVTGDAGRIAIATPQLIIRDGAEIFVSNGGTGEGGSIRISGSLTDIVPASLVTVTGDSSNLRARTRGSGTGGSINIFADQLNIEDRAEVSVSSITTATAGNLNVTARNLFLDRGRLVSTSNTGSGGDLNLDVGDALVLRNNSLVSAEAGTEGAIDPAVVDIANDSNGGDGGNVNLQAGFVVAVPTENSDIRANALVGNGGNVNITTRNLLGLDFRPGVLDTPNSDIAASSEFGIDGTVTITELEPDNLETDAELPADTAPPPLAQGCRAQGTRTGSFVTTGRGGIPTNPTDPLSDNRLWQDIAPLISTLSQSPSSETSPNLERQTQTNNSLEVSRSATATTSAVIPNPASVIEARSWTRTTEGTVTLLAQNAETPTHFLQAGQCQS